MTTPAQPGDVSRFRRYAAALQRAADLFAVGSAWIAGACIAALTLLVLLDTILAATSRYIPSVPSGTGIGWEYSAYLMGAAFVLGAGLTLRAGLQLRVEILMTAGKGKAAWGMDLFSSALGSLVTVSMAIWLAQFTIRTYGFGEVSESSFTPLWIPRLVLTIGVSILAFQMIARLVTCITGGIVTKPELGAQSAIE